MNVQSCRKKTATIQDYMNEKDLDLLVITESWHFSYDSFIMDKLQLDNYKLDHLPRDSRQGGGIMILYKPDISITDVQKGILTSCECMITLCSHAGKSMRLVCIYHLQHDKNKKKIPIYVFL